MNAAKASAAFGGDGPSAPPSSSSAVVPAAAADGSGPSAPYKARPARKQITTARLAAIRQEADKSGNTGQAYNIWYNKYSGGEQGDSMGNKTKAQTRCDVARDAGYTRGDSAAVRPYICLFFARGYCPLGSECNHLHRLPAAAGISEQGRDIFGRDKHGDYRDDMGGVGSLQRVNRTLYVGRIIEEADSFSRPQSAGGGGANMPAGGGGWAGGKVLQQAKAGSGGGAGGKLRKEGKEQMSGTERVLRRHFSEWGEIQRIKVLHTRSCAFVTYVHEAQAQFAKEAMSNQSLDHDEVLNVRWATDDPNEGAQKRDRDERESEGRAAIERNLTDEQRAAGAAVRALEMAELEEESDAKRRRLEEEEYAKLVEENERNWAEMEAQEMLRLQAEEEAALQQQTSRFVSREALGGLLALRKEPPPQAPKQSALGGLAGYGSDSEED